LPEIIFALQEKNSSPSARQTAFPVVFLLDNFRAAIFIGRFRIKGEEFIEDLTTPRASYLRALPLSSYGGSSTKNRRGAVLFPAFLPLLPGEGRGEVV